MKKQDEKKRSLEEFFRSRWFYTLSAMEIQPLLRQIRKGEYKS